MSKYANISTGDRQDALPDILVNADGSITHNPSFDQLAAGGWREVVEVEQPQDGYSVDAYAVQEIDGRTARLGIASQTNLADEAAAKAAAVHAAKVAAMTPQVIQMAQMYRTALRGYFGPEAEINRAVTADVVAALFLAKMAGAYGGMTDTDRDAKDLLQFGFEQLSPISGTNPPNTWELPWGVVP